MSDYNHIHSNHSHKHNHKHHHHSTSDNLLVATVLNFVITLVEIAGGIISNSFALLSDALHNFGDALAIFLAYLSNKISKKTPTPAKTFGFKRVEILAAMINGIAMLVICIYLIIEAIHRFQHPEKINGLVMIVVASIGLLGNFIAMSFLKHDKEKNLNIKAAYIHLLGDTLSSVVVIAGGIFIYFFKIYWLDPVLTFIISIYILKETWFVLKQAYLILLQATPPEIDLEHIRSAIEVFPEVENIHHVHVWKLNDSQIHFECHIDLRENYRISETEAILYKIKNILKEDFSINHTTIQFEFNCCNDKSMIY